MSNFSEVWRFWYEAQLKEQSYNREYFSFGQPTLRPARSFDAADDAEVLRKAMKGLGTNEDDIIKILTQRTLSQRMEIHDKYQQIHGRDLVEDLKGELSGIFEKVILSLMKPLALFFADQVKLAAKGLGTDEDTLIEILCTRDDESLRTIKDAFENENGKSIEELVADETSGHLKTLLMSVLALCRDDGDASPSEVADQLASDDVDEDTIRKIVTSYTFRFLKKVFTEYQEKAGETFLQLVDKKCSKDTSKAYYSIYLVAKNRTEYFAKALHAAMEGRGLDDWALIRIVVSRCEIDLGSIKKKYRELYDKELVEEVKNEIAGDYEKAMVNLLGGDNDD